MAGSAGAGIRVSRIVAGGPTVPDAPDAPTLVEAYATLLSIEWDDNGDGGSAITNHKVRWRLDGTSDPWDEITTGSADTDDIIGGGILTASTDYEVQVLATNGVGDSAWSASAVLTTSAVWSPGPELMVSIDANHVDLSGNDITEFNDQSGNGRDMAPQFGGSRLRVVNAFVNKDGAQYNGLTHYQTNFTSNNSEYFLITVLKRTFYPATGSLADGEIFTTFGSSHVAKMDSSGIITMNGGSPLGVAVAANQDFSYTTYWENNLRGHYINGDTSELVTGTSDGAPHNQGTFTWLSSDNNHPYTGTGQCAYLVKDNNALIPRYEGLVHWAIFCFNKQLASDHPYRYFSPTGVVVVPAAPASVTAVPGDEEATITIVPGDDGGADVTFVITSDPEGLVQETDSTDPYVFTGLTNGISYVFNVQQRNAAGIDGVGTDSNAVTPAKVWDLAFARWDLEEHHATDNAADSLGGYTLSPSNNPSPRVLGTHIVRTFAGTSALTSSDADLSCVGHHHSGSAFFRHGGGAYQMIIASRSHSGNINFMVRVESNNDLTLWIGNGSTFTNTTVTTGLAANTWHVLTWSFDIITRKCRYKLNNDPVAEFASLYIPTTPQTFSLAGNVGGEQLVGMMSRSALWNFKLTDAQMAEYNSHWDPEAGTTMLQVTMNGASGANEVDTVHGLVFTQNGTVGAASGLIGGRRTFNGSGQYLSAATSAAISVLNSYPMTVLGWVNSSTVDGDNTQRGVFGNYAVSSFNGLLIAWHQGKIKVWFFRDGSNYVYDGAFGGVESGVIADGNDHHIAVVLDAAGLELYVDGVSVSTRAWTGTPGRATSTSAAIFGLYNSSYHNGSLEVFKVKNYALNATEVGDDYNGGAGVEE